MDGTDIFFQPLRGALPAWIDARSVQYPVSGGNDYLDLLPLVREACRSCDDFFVLGWSFSGPLALMIAAEAPPGLRGVVLCASFISVPWPVIRLLRRAATASVARLFPFVSELLAQLGRHRSDTFDPAPAETAAR